ncbi:MAG TPA: hypothetical protein VLJ18_02620 [Thermoanaerobaculia bacterium]|nr:hypothetical protein [Thermoanaerobaculia bacterium]
MRRPLLRPVARILLVAVAPLALDGCVSIGVSHSVLEPPPGQSAPPTGALAVSVFERAGDRDAGRVASFPVLSELARVTASGEEAVGRSMAPAWSLEDLPPGQYRLRVTRRLTAEGDIVALENPGDRTFEVSAGEKTTVSVVLKKVPVFWIVVAALTVVALVILAIAGSRHGHLPPPPPLPLPPVFVVIPIGGHGEAGMPAPGAADVFPAKGSVVSARRVTVTFLLSAPLAPDGVGENAILALGSKSGEIAGAVSYLERDGLLRFSPSRDFAPGETVTVTLDLSKLRGAGGREGSGRISTSFLVPVARE